MNDLNVKFCDTDYKDASPVKTVEHIKQILASHGIETVESWRQTNVPHCHAMGVQVVGTNFSVNGKGLTPEFARASGYGELMERLQLGMIGSPGVQKDGTHVSVRSKQEWICPQDLFDAEPQIYQILADRLKAATGTVMEPEKLPGQYSNAQGKVACVPCYDLVKGRKVYFPDEYRLRVYATNGCAAGNSTEEAIVQAIGEIVERANQNRIVSEGLTVPDIPEEDLKKFQVAYAIITHIRSKGYRVLIKDCSLGERFPVICACFIDTKTGKYHTHFGANPVVEIALERALTESFQGANIDNVAKFQNISMGYSKEYSLSALTNEFTKGTWEKSVEFFVGQPSYEYNRNMGFQGKNNKELLRECVDYFARKGHQILVYNSATLGFPACHVIIPGCSEIFINRLCKDMNEQRYHPFAVKTLRDPSGASISDMLGLLLHLDQTKQLSSNLNRVHGFLAASRLSAKLTPDEEQFLMSGALGYVYYAMGRYGDVVSCLSSMIAIASGDDLEYLICLKRYLSMKQEKRDPEMIRSVLTLFHRSETIEQLKSCLAAKGNPFERFTLHCDLDCKENCRLYPVCYRRKLDELDCLLDSKLTQMDFDQFCADLRELLS